jgi:hypothetical protein
MIPPALVEALADLSVVEAVLISAALFAVTGPPVMRLARVDFHGLVESGCADRLLIVVGPALHAAREAALDAAALLILLTTRPQGALS